MKQKLEIKQTADGSDTLFNPGMDDTYHSINGAVQESMHVFIEAGLHQVKKQKLRIFEVGFGTGLNALLSWQEAHRLKLQIEYESIEAFPVAPDLISSLNYSELGTGLPNDAFLLLHQAVWNSCVVLEKNIFALKKIQADFTSFQFTERYDLIFFDAFAPDKQPEMWAEEGFSKIYQALHPGGILVTYCAKGEVRRRLQRAGFRVERLPGPPGKREILRAIKL